MIDRTRDIYFLTGRAQLLERSFSTLSYAALVIVCGASIRDLKGDRCAQEFLGEQG